MNPILTFANALLGAIAVAIIGALVKVIGSLASMRKVLDRLVAADAARSEAIQIIARIQRPQLTAHRATLEALKGECNGNITEAHRLILEVTQQYDEDLARLLVSKKPVGPAE